MNGGSSPESLVSKRREHVPESDHILADGACGILLYEVSDLRGVAAIHDPAGLRGFIKICLNFCTKFICRVCLPIRPPTQGTQAGMRYIQ